MVADSERDYVPAAPQLWLYDALVVVLARAWRWRRALLAQLAPREGDVIADVGCGTGTQLVKIGRAAPGVTLIGIDPDPDVLHRARRKLANARILAGLTRGYARDAADLLRDRAVNKIISSLVFHQVPLEEKKRRLHAVEEVQREVSLAKHLRLVGQEVEVLGEGRAKGLWYGRTRTNRLVHFEFPTDPTGMLVHLRVIHAGPWSLNAGPLAAAGAARAG